MTFSELKKVIRDFNDKHGIERKVDYKYNDKGELIRIVARVVIAKGVFYPQFDDIKYRTLTFNNYEKALTSNDLGYSIFAYCEYDKTSCRIEHYSDSKFENCEILEVIE